MLEDERREARDHKFRLEKKIDDLSTKLVALSVTIEQLTVLTSLTGLPRANGQTRKTRGNSGVQTH